MATVATVAHSPSLKDYVVQVFWSGEDKCFVANVPDLEFCSAFGETPEEAIRQLQIAAVVWLRVAVEGGRPVPAPSMQPVSA